MPFRFRLKVLLEHREYLKKEAQTALAAAQNTYREYESQRVRVTEEIGQQKLLLQQRQAEGIHVAEHLSFIDYIRSLEQHLLELDEAIERAFEEVDQKRTFLIEKEKQVKMLDSLKQNEAESYHDFELKRDRKRADQVAIIKDFRKKHANPEHNSI